MAITFSSFNNFRIDMLDPHTMGGGVPVGMPTVTSDKVTWQTTTGSFELYGTGFSVDRASMSLSGTANRVTYSEGGVVLASADGMSLNGDQVRQISMSPQTVDALIQALIPGDNVFRLSGGNDVVDVGAGNDIIYGGAGRDTAIIDIGWTSPGRGSYDISKQPDGTIVITNGADRVELHDVERVRFSDGVVAFDETGAAGQAYRLYQAAFDRTPDAGGLSYWVDNQDAGGNLKAMAANFIGSNEFQSTYGNLSDAAFVDQLYQNVLDRSADGNGLQYWVSQLEARTIDRAGVLVGFSESAENVALVGAAFEDGIWLGL